MAKPAIEKTALVLPRTVDRPPAKPQKIVTGSISRPDKPTFVQTKSKVFMRAQAKADAPIIATLRPRTVMRELARSGEWRLVMGDGRKGWVRADYLAKSPVLAAPAETAGRGRQAGYGIGQARQSPVNSQKALNVSVVSERTMPGTLATCSLMNLPMSSSVSM